MSADNWGICPKCRARNTIDRKAAQVSLSEQYGKISLEDYKALEKKFAEMPEDYEVYELREDYEFHMSDDGEFFADYSAHCYNDECDFNFKFRHQETVEV